jgi:hypothetical protein
MAKRERPMAMDGYVTQLIIKADALGRSERQIKERPAPPAPMMSKAEASIQPSQSVEPTSK